MSKMDRRSFLKSAAVAAGLAVVGGSAALAQSEIVTSKAPDRPWREFYAAFYSESRDAADLHGDVTSAFRRAMQQHAFTEARGFAYDCQWMRDQGCWFHTWMAELR